MADLASWLSVPPAPRPGILLAGLAAAAVAAFVGVLATRPTLGGDPAAARALEAILLWHGVLPRAVTALLAGAALGLAGALLQRVLRNPIADPSTLGIASGAQLALTAASVYAPALMATSRAGIAFAGGVAAVALVLAVAWKRGLEPVTVVIAGMTISLVAAALGSAMVLANGEYVLSLFIWGAGALQQQSWEAPAALAVRTLLGGLAAVLMLRPLAVLGLDDASARGLGLALAGARLAVVAVAVFLAASVTAEVGIVGFVGLAAPALCRAAGVRSHRRLLVAAPLVGALLLWLTDGVVQLAAGDGLPTGAATGLLGGPLLLWLLPRLSVADRPSLTPPSAPRRLGRPWQAAGAVAGLAVLAIGVSLVVGRDLDGFSFATGALFADLLPFRLPRLLAAAAAGALLGAAGTLMQRMTGNPLAGPEVMGVGAGAGVGLGIVLLTMSAPGLAAMSAGSAAGALTVLAVVLAFGLRSGFGPERMLLGGIAVGSVCLAIITAILATGDRSAFQLLVWMSGSTDRVGLPEAVAAVAAAAVLLAPVPFAARWLDVLPLGDAAARTLGLPATAARAALSAVAALMVAVAALVVGPLSLVGLIGPHLARLLGFARGLEQLVAAALLGATLMIAVDWLGRVVSFPYQIPAGLLAALVGGPYLIWLLRRAR